MNGISVINGCHGDQRGAEYPLRESIEGHFFRDFWGVPAAQLITHHGTLGVG